MAKKKKKAKLSDNEKKAAAAGQSVKEYNAAKKGSSSGSQSSSSKDEKKAKKEADKYYDQKESDIKQQADTKTKRLQEDLTKLMADAGVAQTRATEDYIRNIANIESGKELDTASILDYVQTNTGRTQEDLETSLGKELRRFSLETDQVNMSLAASGATFSDRTSERIAREGNALATKEINMNAARSFADIRRYEAAKNAEIELRYSQNTEQANATKTRTIEDILNEQQMKAEAIKRGEEDIAFGKAVDIRDNTYAATDTKSSIENMYDAQENSLLNTQTSLSVTGP